MTVTIKGKDEIDPSEIELQRAAQLSQPAIDIDASQCVG